MSPTRHLEIFPHLIGLKRISGYRAKDFGDVFERYLHGRVAGDDPLILSDQKSKPKLKPKKSKRKKRG